MTGFLTQQVHRSQGTSSVVQPRIASQFAPASIAANLSPFSVFQPASLSREPIDRGINSPPLEAALPPSPSPFNLMPALPSGHWSTQWSRLPRSSSLEIAQLAEQNEHIATWQAESVGSAAVSSPAPDDRLPTSESPPVSIALTNAQDDSLSHENDRPTSLSSALPAVAIPEQSQMITSQPLSAKQTPKPEPVEPVKPPQEVTAQSEPIPSISISIDRSISSSVPPFPGRSSVTPALSSTPLSSSAALSAAIVSSPYSSQTSEQLNSSVSATHSIHSLNSSSETEVTVLHPSLTPTQSLQTTQRDQTLSGSASSIYFSPLVRANSSLSRSSVVPVASSNLSLSDSSLLNSSSSRSVNSLSQSSAIQSLSPRSSSESQTTLGLPTLLPISASAASVAPAAPAAAALASAAPAIHITIGRIEVRNTSAVPSSSARKSSSSTSSSKPKLSLNDYLTQRHGRSTGGQP